MSSFAGPDLARVLKTDEQCPPRRHQWPPGLDYRILVASFILAAVVLAIGWRVWTPIAGAARPFSALAFAGLWWCSVGTSVWLRMRGATAAVAIAAGVVVLLAYPASALAGPARGPLSWAPWALASVELWRRRPVIGVLGFALALVLGAYSGPPMAFVWSLFVIAPLACAAHAPRAVHLAIAVGACAVACAARFYLADGAMVSVATPVRTTELTALLLPRLPGPNIYCGFVLILGAGAELGLRPSPRSLLLAVLFIAGLLFGATGPATLAFAALGADGLMLLASIERPAIGTWLARVGFIGAVGLGLAVLLTAGAVHAACIYALCSWVASAWLVQRVVAADAPVRGRFLLLAAIVLICDVWFARVPALEAGFTAKIAIIR